MTDTNYEAFRNKLILEELIFEDEGLSETSRKMNQWRFGHLLGLARVASVGSEKVTLDSDFQSQEMMAFFDERLKLSGFGLFSIEDLFDALISVDPAYASAPSATSPGFSEDAYCRSLEAMLTENSEARPWRENQPSLKVTKTSFPGTAPEIPLPPDLRK